MKRPALLPLALLLASTTARAANTRYNPPPPVLVHLQFEGDPSFPNLNFVPNPGLARFTGANFGLSTFGRSLLITKIQELLDQAYAGFNIRFVTVKPAGTNFFIWGIDDSSFTFSDSGCDSLPTPCRLFGKAGAGRDAVDNTGQSLFQPRFARTFGGSFTFPSNSASPSQPPLVLGRTFSNGVTITIDHIARAVANDAAHELGHLFGLVHPPRVCGTDPSCFNTRIMQTMNEEIEATHVKTFNQLEKDILQKSLGPRGRLTTGIAGALQDDAAGLMWTRDARLAATHPTASVGTATGGALSFTDAQSYASSLDFLGYNDWRLPSATDADGGNPCRYVFTRTSPPRLILDCNTGELGRLDFQPIPALPSSPFFNFAGGSYWATSFDASSWIYSFDTHESGQAAPATAVVWPVRTTGTLVDNGDGTITDTVRRLMWAKDPGQLGSKTAADARAAVAGLNLAGHRDWRLPRIDSLTDQSCANLDAFLQGNTSGGCQQNELVHLMRGWGITTSNAAPFVMPAGGGPVWFDDIISGVSAQPVSFSFNGGVIRTDTAPADVGAVFAVRALLPNEVPRGMNVIVEPTTNAVVRFPRVTTTGVLQTVVFNVASITGPIRFFNFSTNFDFDGQATICLRFGGQVFQGTPSSIRVARRNAQGGFESLPVINGYPDNVNKVVCGRTSTPTGDFFVADNDTF